MPTTFQMPDSSSPSEETTIERLAVSPRRVRTDEGTVEERPADDIIKLDQYTNPIPAAGPPWGIGLARFRPGSALGTNENNT